MIKNISKIIRPLSIISLFSIVIYYFFRVYFFEVNQFHKANFVFSLALLIGESYMIIQSIGFTFDIFRTSKKRYTYQTDPIPPSQQPFVAVVVAARNEPEDVLFQTFATLRSLDWQNKNIYLLDGSDDQKFLKQDKEICDKFDVKVFHPSVMHGAKAGIENDFIKTMKEEYLAVFDADQNPAPNFLQATVALAERDKRVGFVQTPQFYSNLEAGPITRAAAMQQAVFYESICEAKGSINAMFCCGTNVLFRRDALIDAGGFDETSITEDFATSIKIHLKGWKSIYYNHVNVFGMGPETLPAYFKQQSRWAAGTTGVFRKILIEFFKNPFRLTLSQWWEYFLSGTYYFIGWAFLLLMICPTIYLFFGVPSYFMNPYIYLLSYTPYFLMTLIVFYSSMRKRHYSSSDVYTGMTMGSLMFPIFLAASFMGIIGKKMAFVVTPKGKSEKAPFLSLWPWHLVILVNLIAISVGLSHFWNNPYAIAINIFWVSYHTFILSRIYSLNKEPKIEKYIIPKEVNG